MAAPAALHTSASPRPRLLSVVYRVKDLDVSIKFYVECLGMMLLGKHEHPIEKYMSAFLGYGHQQSHFIIEMKHYPNSTEFNLDNDFGHIGINVTNIYQSLEVVKSKGGKVLRDAIQLKGASVTCAFVEDPNGYEIELLERSFIGDPLCQVMFQVIDLDQSISFYEKAFGMQKLRMIKLDVHGMQIQIAFLGFGPENRTTVLELNSIQGVTNYDKGNTFEHLLIEAPNIDSMMETLQQHSKCVPKCENLIIHGLRSENKIEEIAAISVFDPNGFKLVFVDI